jgi:methionyl-tRNA synthetase
MKSNKKYITTTLPYVNGDPHIGFTMEIVRADSLARYYRYKNFDVFFNTGTDEHGSKLYEKALELGMTPQAYVDKNAENFKDLAKLLNISNTAFIRTTDEKHKKAAQKMWQACFDNGDIYKKQYKTKYCIGCELEKTDSELVDGKCPDHPNREIEIREEENYFFKFSNYEQKLLDLYASKDNKFVIPESKQNEVKNFVAGGLQDFSISRLKSKMPWGVEVPNDSEHVMYVWFDALTSYISTLGWGTDNKDFKYWTDGEPVQYCGKDNNRQQSAMWQAMLMSAGINNTSNIVINGFVQIDGHKMSKSTGYMITGPQLYEIFKEVALYPEDVVRFMVLSEISSFEDGDVSIDGFKAAYQGKLQNGLGNLASRILKMSSTHLENNNFVTANDLQSIENFINDFDHQKAMQYVNNKVTELDQYIQKEEPFKVIKVDAEKGKGIIRECVQRLNDIAILLKVYLPNTSTKILELIELNQIPEKPLFNRLS